MYFLVDKDKKIIFGWSAKSGCRHVINIFKYLTEYPKNTNIDDIPDNLEDYNIFLFIRNPFERIISGFLDKYHQNGEYRYLWESSSTLTFRNFLFSLLKNEKYIEKHHFSPQTSEDFEKLMKKKPLNLKIYDIKYINYEFIEKIMGKKIPDDLKKPTGEYKFTDYIHHNIYDLHIDEYHGLKAHTKNFYDKELENIIKTYYKDDFEFFKSYGFDYELNK